MGDLIRLWTTNAPEKSRQERIRVAGRATVGLSEKVVEQFVGESGEVPDSLHDSSKYVLGSGFLALDIGPDVRVEKDRHRGRRRTWMSFCAVTGLPARVAGR